MSVYAGGRFAEAVEILGRDRFGWRFVLLLREGDAPPWGEMRDRIKEHLSRRDVVRDEKGELHLLHRTIRAQLQDPDEFEDGPRVLVDDLDLSWSELGALLASHVGWKLEIKIKDPSEI